jgi:hypothetical protein
MSETLKDDVQDSEPEPTSEGSGASDRARELIGRPRVQLILGAAILVAAGAVIGWAVVVRNADSGGGAGSVNPVAPVGLSASGLRTLAAAVGQPIYWAGPRPGYLYELTRTKTGSVFIRYLPPGDQVGTRKVELTIATYPYRHALEALKNVNQGRQHTLPRGGLALIDTRSPQNVHIAFPRVNYQVVVFDSSAARSQRVALSGRVRPVS